MTQGALMKPKSRILTGLCLAVAWNIPVLKAQETYQKPPAAILKTLHADLPAQPSISPAGDRMILQTPLRYPSIQELAEPYLRLAGVRVTPRNRSIHSSP